MNEILIVAGLGVLTLLAEIFSFKKFIAPIVIAGLLATWVVAALELNGNIYSSLNASVLNMLDFDRYAQSFVLLLTTIALLWVIINYNFFSDESNKADHLSLILFSMVGGFCMVSYTNFVMLFLGIEILSIPMYVLAGSNKRSLRSNEASLKYFLMGSFATGILLFGIALLYGSTGSFYVYDLRVKTTGADFVMTPMFTIGMVMLLSAMAFKSSAAPFHFWAPDVYTGSPSSVTSFMSTFVKTSALAAFMRLFYTALPYVPETFDRIFLILIIGSLFLGNIIAVFQTNAKRLLAYSSISHVGFMLMAIRFFSEPTSVASLFFYMAAYAITTLAAFMVLKIVEENSDGDVSISAFNGLVKRNPLLAGTLTIALLSMAGIPPLSGFFAKFNILYIALNHGYFWLVIVAILASLVGVYYYFKIVIAMFASEPVLTPITLTGKQKILLLLLTLLIVGMGLNSFVFDLIPS